MNEESRIHLAPIQGYTDKAYRNAIFSSIGGIDCYYSPYLSISNRGMIDNAHDIEAINPEQKAKLIPQILANDLTEADRLGEFVKVQGYSKININCGCPYAMVTNKGRGAALLTAPDLVTQMLNLLIDKFQLKVNLKVRLGLNDAGDIFRFLSEIDRSILEYVIVHPRTAVQLYKGKADLESFLKCKNEFTDLNLIYNGDIVTTADYDKVIEGCGHYIEVMIGRGMLYDPFLANEIKSRTSGKEAVDLKLSTFVITLLNSIREDSSDEGHALNRIKQHLKYLLEEKSDYKRLAKKIQKSRTLDDIYDLVDLL